MKVRQIKVVSLMVALAAGGASAAAQQPDKTPAPVPAPAAPAAPDPAVQPPAAGPVVPLEKLVRDSLNTNLGLRSARATTRAVEEGVDGARSIFDPLLTASPNFSSGPRDLLLEPGNLQTGTESGRGVAAGVSGTLPTSTGYAVALDHSRLDLDNPLLSQFPQPSANTSMTFTLRQPLLRGFGPTYARAPVRLARLGSQSSQQRLERSAELTVANVETLYWSLGLAQAFEDVARASYLRADTLLQRNQKMFDLKLITEVDLITSRRGIQQRLTALTDATRRRQDAAERLLYAVYGEHAEEQIRALLDMRTEDPPGSAPEVPSPEQVETQVIDRRGDVRAARLDVEQADFNARVTRNALLPDLALSGSYATRAIGTEGFTFNGTNRPGDLAASDWRVGISFTYPLFNRAARADNARARWDADNQAVALATAESNVRSEVRAATRAVRSESARLEQSKLFLEYARAQYDGAQKQLQLGLVDSFRLLQMEEDVANAELTYQQVRYDLAQALTNYALATDAMLERYDARSEGPIMR